MSGIQLSGNNINKMKTVYIYIECFK